MCTDRESDGGNHEIRRIIRPLLIAMELVGGWVHSPVKWGIAYIFKNIYSLFIILISLWPLIKFLFLVDGETEVGYELFLSMIITVLSIASFTSVWMSYTRYFEIPNFLNLVAARAWACVHMYRKKCRRLIRLGIVLTVLFTIINNFVWLAFSVDGLQSVSVQYAKPFDMSNMAVWVTLLVTSFLTIPTFLSLVFNGIFLVFSSWILYKSFKSLSDTMSKQHAEGCLIDQLDLHKKDHLELTRLVAKLDWISAAYIGGTILMFTFNCCLITYNLSVSGRGFSLHGSIVTLVLSVGYFIPSIYASDKLNNVVSV